MAKQYIPFARPFMKWAGGKTQLLGEFKERLPHELKDGTITNYVEPFIGGGAVFFALSRQFSFKECCLCDANGELVLTYKVIRQSVRKLIAELESLESDYLARNDAGRESFYYAVRDAFNGTLRESGSKTYGYDHALRAAQIIFLNRTCFNGLFRLNQNGEFNVPFGKYKKPGILNAENLKRVSALMKTTRIIHGDFTVCRKFVDHNTFVYLDPPYRPLNQTSSFTSYSKDGFSDRDQERLAGFFRELDNKGAKIMLSNSDPRNEDPDDTFFDDLYEGFRIERIPAKRMINCNGARRGEINELIITNYPYPEP
jgi:DNA adenine methylase